MVESCVRGFHVYQDIWTPTAGGKLSCVTEDTSPMDPYAFAIKRRTEVIGHVPRTILAACFFLYKEAVFSAVLLQTPVINTFQIWHRVVCRFLAS